jgi:DNA mismatch endonuclease (patch repair protein)
MSETNSRQHKVKRRIGGHLLVFDTATSQRMSGVRRRDTSPEMNVRRALHSLGIHYRTRNRDLPGSPDVANRKRKWALFVHGCFWHRHRACRRTTTPKRNRGFWVAKFAANCERDARKMRLLRAAGFRVLVVWECEAEASEHVRARLRSFLPQKA